MLIENTPLVRMAISAMLYPVMAILLYGAARLIAMVLVRIIPDGRLKQALFRDTDTGLLAYKPGVRRQGFLKRRALRRWDA